MNLPLLLVLLATVLGIPFMRKLKKIEITRIDGMCRGQKVPITVLYRGTKSAGNVLWFNITLTVKEDIIGPSHLTVRVNRCISKENLDSCESYRNFTINYCQMLDVTSLTPFYIKYEPDLKCPFKKGVYRAVDSKLDMSPLIRMPIDKYYWKINADVRGVNDKMLMCIVVEAYSIPEINA